MALAARVHGEPCWAPCDTAGVLRFRGRLWSSPSPLCCCGSEANLHKAQSSRFLRGAGSGMEPQSCDRWLLAELLHVRVCICQRRVTHMLHAGLWPGPLEWFTAVPVLCTFSRRHKSASCWFCFVGLFVFFTRSCFAGTFANPPQQRFLFMQRMDGDRRWRVYSVVVLCLWTCCIMLCFCASHTLQEKHTPDPSKRQPNCKYFWGCNEPESSQEGIYMNSWLLFIYLWWTLSSS